MYITLSSCKLMSESLFFKAIGDIMVSVFPRECGRSVSLSPVEFKLKTIELGICCSSAKHTALRSTRKDQNNVSEWSGMSTHEMLFQRKRGNERDSQHYNNPAKRVDLVQSRHHHHIIEIYQKGNQKPQIE